MQKPKWYVSISLLVVLLPLQARGQFNLAVDFGTFRYDTAKTYTEIYYSIPIAELKFLETESGIRQAQVMVRLAISKNGSTWREEAWRMAKTVTDTLEIQAGNRMVDVVRYLMEPGEYQAALYVEDLNNPQTSYKVERELAVSDFPRQTLSLSNIQFASQIKSVPQDTSNLFYKHGLEVIPEPGAIYGKGSPMLYYYLEAYHLAKAIKGDTYKTRCWVTDSQGAPLATMKSREQIKKKMEASVEVGAINVSMLPSGVYDFQFGILGAQDELLQSVSKKFYVYNPEVKGPERIASENLAAAVLTSEFAAMSEKELDSEFEMAQYIAGKEEKKAYESLEDAESKRQFLYEFWWRKDPTPATAINEYRKEYQRRIAYTNDNFRSYTRKGWKTDRGRVYVIYGPPNDIERFPNNPLSYSYEIWRYDQIEGGVIFVFADLQEFGEHMQLHSTKRGEPVNEDWERQIRK